MSWRAFLAASEVTGQSARSNEMSDSRPLSVPPSRHGRERTTCVLCADFGPVVGGSEDVVDGLESLSSGRRRCGVDVELTTNGIWRNQIFFGLS